jgi:hypothetical protein
LPKNQKKIGCEAVHRTPKQSFNYIKITEYLICDSKDRKIHRLKITKLFRRNFATRQIDKTADYLYLTPTLMMMSNIPRDVDRKEKK